MRMDVTPLRTSRDFRLLFLAGTVFYLGGMVSYVAIPFQVYDADGLQLRRRRDRPGRAGAAGRLRPVRRRARRPRRPPPPARRHGRRQAVLTAVLAVNAFRDEPSIPLIFVVAGLLDGDRRPAAAQPRGADAAHGPPRPDHRRQRADQLRDAGRRAGRPGDRRPARRLRRHRLVLRRRRRRPGRRDRALRRDAALPAPGRDHAAQPAGHRRGLAYAVRRKDLLGTYLVDIVCMLLAFPVVLFPALAADVFDAPAAARPALLRRDRRRPARHRALAAGPRASTTTAGPSSSPRRRTACSSAWSGWRRRIGVALGFLVLAGAADMISGVFRGTVWNQTIPEHMRGRLAGIEMLSYSVGPLGGQVRAGLVADLWSVRGAIVSGGFACVVGVAHHGRGAARLLEVRRPHRRARDRRAGAAGGAAGSTLGLSAHADRLRRSASGSKVSATDSKTSQ